MTNTIQFLYKELREVGIYVLPSVQCTLDCSIWFYCDYNNDFSQDVLISFWQDKVRQSAWCPIISSGKTNMIIYTLSLYEWAAMTIIEIYNWMIIFYSQICI